MKKKYLSNKKQLWLFHRMAFHAVVLGFFAAYACSTFAEDALCVNYNRYADNPIEIDGVLKDKEWRTSNQYVFNNSTSQPDAVVQMTRDSQAVYLSFQIHNDKQWNDQDVIVLAISPDNVPDTGSVQNINPGNDHRIHIFPNTGNGINSGYCSPSGVDDPRAVFHWKDSSTWNTSAQQPSFPLPAWLDKSNGNIKVRCIDASAKDSDDDEKDSDDDEKFYLVEMKIPISQTNGIPFPSNGNFTLYFNLIRVYFLGGSLETVDGDADGELRWPPSAPTISNSAPARYLLTTNTPDPTQWGRAKLEDNCAGVQVTNRYTNNPSNPNAVDPHSANNRFNITLTNRGTADASGITATIKHSRFGIASPGVYNTIPKFPPLGPSGVIFGRINPPYHSETLVSQAWDITQDPNQQDYINDPDFCSWIELNATGGGTLISNRFHGWNMEFATASTFEHTAIINGRGLGLPPPKLDLHVTTTEEVFKRDALMATAMRQKENEDSSLERKSLMGTDGVRTASGYQLIGSLVRNIQKLIQNWTNQWTSVLTRCVHGFRHTDKLIQIGDRRFALKERVNSFCYVIAHNGLVKTWNQEFSGRGVYPLNNEGTRYTVQFAPGEVETQVKTTITAVERPIEEEPLPWWLLFLILLMILLILYFLWSSRTANPSTP